MPIQIKKPSSKLLCHSWVLYGLSDKDTLNARKEVDKAFRDYSFYPSLEWDEYGIYPPEGHTVLGAWRQTESKAFAFLIDNPSMSTGRMDQQLLVYVIGEDDELRLLEPRLMILKKSFSFKEDNIRSNDYLRQRLTRIEKSKSLTYLSGILTIYTAIVNAFSLYLRQLAPPPTWSPVLITIVNGFASLVHISALLLLIVFIFFVGAFVFRYGILLLKRM
jgi:hypothetical protein